MTAITKALRFRCYEADGTTVAWTETVNIASTSEVGGQRVHPTSSQTTARPWTVEIVDKSGAITARLSDGDGRAHLLHRLGDLSETTDVDSVTGAALPGATWTVLATARIARITAPQPGSYFFEMQDERLIERNTTIFLGSNTTRILPAGLDAPWLVYQGGVWTSYRSDLDGSATNYNWVGQNSDGTEVVDPLGIPEFMWDLIEADVVDAPAAGQGNFRTLRCNVNGVDREIISFNGSPGHDPLKLLRDRPGLQVWAFRLDFADSDGFDREIVIHMKSLDPSSELPLHIGGREGIDAFTLVKNIYDGAYQPGTPQTVRYELNAFSAYHPSTNPNGLVDNPRFQKQHFWPRGPENMAEWLDDNIYGPLGVVAFVNAANELSPRIVTMPAVDQVADPDALPELTPATLSAPHPSWSNEGREQVTVVKVHFEYAIAPSAIRLSGGGGLFGGLLNPGLLLPTAGGQDSGADLLVQKTRTIVHEHDRATDIRVTHEITVRGIHRPLEQARFAKAYALAMFERFGDGPVYTDAVPLAAVSDVAEGAWVRINLPGSFPALQNQSRTGSRIAQVIERVLSAGDLRPRYKLLEGGANDQPLSTPAISLAANSDDPENAIDATISGLSAGERYEIHLAVGASEPTEGDPDWQYQTIKGTANETITVRGMPAGSTIWGRVRATAPNRISSDWSSADSQATTGLTAPSTVLAAGITGDEATVTWTNGEPNFDVMLDVITDPGGVQVVAPIRLPAGTTRWKLTGLALSTDYTVRVWHADDFGGESTKGTDDFSTTGTATTLPKPRGLRVLVGVLG